MESSEADRDTIRNLVGLYAGQLTNDERIALERCLLDDYVILSYKGAAGLLSMPKIKLA